MPANCDHLTDAFPRLKEIQLNDTRMTWTDMKLITAFMPQLEAIEMGYNQLSRLADATFSTSSYNTTVRFLNLDTNLISDWVHVCTSLKEYASYVTLSMLLTILVSLSLYVKFTARHLDCQFCPKYSLSKDSFRFSPGHQISISVK
jgi:hypothetical protein